MKTGSELKRLLASIGIVPHSGCNCLKLMEKMNEWGPEGCRKNFFEIVNLLEEDSKKYKWSEKVSATRRAMETGLAHQIKDWTDPIGGLVMLAIDNSMSKPPPERQQ